MITLKEWLEIVNYRVTEGSNFLWNCYGPDSYSLDSWDHDPDGSSFTIVFDTRNQCVYEVQAHDYKNQRAYRLVNPDYIPIMLQEAEYRNINKQEAWENVNYVDLESEDDWLQKALAIAAGDEYDTRVSIPLELDDADLLTLMKQAHAADLTFNEFVEDILRDFISQHD